MEPTHRESVVYAKPGTARTHRPCCQVLAARDEVGHDVPFDRAAEVLLQWPDGVAYWHPGPRALVPARERAAAVPDEDVDAEQLAWLLGQCISAPANVRTKLIREDGRLDLFWVWPDARCSLRASAAATSEASMLAASEAGGIVDQPHDAFPLRQPARSA